jgi:hypothetical protein
MGLTTCSMPILVPIVALFDELLVLFGKVPLDCEFAVTREADGEVLWLLQAWPLVLSGVPDPEAVQAAHLESIQRTACSRTQELYRPMESQQSLARCQTLRVQESP